MELDKPRHKETNFDPPKKIMKNIKKRIKEDHPIFKIIINHMKYKI